MKKTIHVHALVSFGEFSADINCTQHCDCGSPLEYIKNASNEFDEITKNNAIARHLTIEYDGPIWPGLQVSFPFENVSDENIAEIDRIMSETTEQIAAILTH